MAIDKIKVGSTEHELIAHGLTSDSAEKIKLDSTNIAYCTCSTAKDVAAKVISISGNDQWTLTTGSMITVLFSATNEADNPTFNVNGTGAKNVYYGASKITTSSLSYAGYANRPMNFVYDGTQYRFIGWGYDGNTDTKVQQNAAITTAGEYPVVLAYSTSTSKVTNAVNKTSTLKYNPSTQILTAPTFKGALEGNATTATSATSATKATQDASGNTITSTYETKSAANTKLAEAKSYADAAAAQVKSDLLNGAGVAYDTLKELGDLIDDNTDAIDALETVAAGKADKNHTHNYAGSSSAGGAATSANKVNSSLAIKLNGGTTEGTNLFTFNGSGAKTVNITPSAIGAATSSHTHDDRYYTETEIDTKLSGKASTSAATQSANGLMSSADKKKLDGLATVATSGSYNDLSNKPSIPTVYTESQCTTFSSDSGTCTPLAVQKAAKMFAIPKVTSTNKAITRFDGTGGAVQNSKIIIEDVTNTRDTSKKAQVIAIPAEGDKKMVYGYCTDQIDGTSFIGGVFDKSATSYPYNQGLAIGGTSGNLLWKGTKVATVNDIPTLSSLGAVPTSRTVNGKKLTSNISLTASDVGAAPAYTYGTEDMQAGVTSLETGKLYFVYE